MIIMRLLNNQMNIKVHMKHHNLDIIVDYLQGKRREYNYIKDHGIFIGAP